MGGSERTEFLWRRQRDCSHPSDVHWSLQTAGLGGKTISFQGYLHAIDLPQVSDPLHRGNVTVGKLGEGGI